MSAEPAVNEARWTIGRLLSWTTEFLTLRGLEDGRLSAEVLLAYALDCKRIDLYARIEDAPEEEATARFRELVRRAANHEPIAYLVGTKEFFSLSFSVTRDVLIPRPETETLVEFVLDDCSQRGLAAPRLLDLGTGSGCIVVTLLKQLGGATAMATDLSRAALNIARENAAQHEVADRVTFVEADCCALENGADSGQGFDLIVSNPPYVRLDEMDSLDDTVRDYEPHTALTDGQDGLSFYKSLAVGAHPLLADDGKLAVEIGDGMEAAVKTVMESPGLLGHEATIKDRVTGRERVLVFRRV